MEKVKRINKEDGSVAYLRYDNQLAIHLASITGVSTRDIKCHLEKGVHIETPFCTYRLIRGAKLNDETLILNVATTGRSSHYAAEQIIDFIGNYPEQDDMTKKECVWLSMEGAPEFVPAHSLNSLHVSNPFLNDFVIHCINGGGMVYVRRVGEIFEVEEYIENDD